MLTVQLLVAGLYLAIAVFLTAAWVCWRAAKRLAHVTKELEVRAQVPKAEERVWHIQAEPMWVCHGDRTLH